ncbi:hypothetical protein DFH28DRAFT_923538 [Melampsora americana]|nr:hypothetical protein DFH28DRAFT_923538 [Melampsora americana]
MIMMNHFNQLWTFLVNQLQFSSFIQVISSSPSTSILTNAPSTTSTSTIYVQHTSRIHASCPAGFGPHFDNPDGRLMKLLPIESITHPNTKTNDSNPPLQNKNLIEARRGCPPPELLTFLSNPLDLTIDHSQLLSASQSSVLEPPHNWIALVERGTCTFVDKIRYAQHLGASAVIVGDWESSPISFKTNSGPIFYSNPLGSDKFGFGTGLVTMYAPGDTSDLDIPSVFIARDSYMSLREDWLELNTLRSPSNPPIHGQSVGHHLPQALEVIMSKDQLWTWPFFDLLIILLFLPSILTAVTLVLHRINLFRKRRADRAPQAFVDRLPCVIWAKDMEKGIPVESELTDSLEESKPRSKKSVIGLGWIKQTRNLISTWSIFQRHSPSTDSEHTPLLDPSRPPLKSNRSLPIPKVYFAQRECALCLSDFEVGDLVRILPCGHCFHQAEITNHCMGIDCWLLKSKRLCPICRMSIMEQENEETVKLSTNPSVPDSTPISSSDLVGSSLSPIPIRSTPHIRSPIPSSSSVTLDHARLPSRR